MRKASTLSVAFSLLVACGSPDENTGDVAPHRDGNESSAGDGGAGDTGSDPTADADPATQDGGADSTPLPLDSPLALHDTLDLNAVVATKGLAVTDDGSRVYVWNHNQNLLKVWNGTSFDELGSGLVTSYGTDVAVDSEGNVYVSKGGSTVGETIRKWDGGSGVDLWGPGGLSIDDGLMLGLTTSTIDGTEFLFACDGRPGGSGVLKLALTDGAVVDAIAVDGVPLDVAVTADGVHFVLVSASPSPVHTGDAVSLRKYSADGKQVGQDAPAPGGQYLTLAGDGLVYVSSSNFGLERRQILAFDQSLTPLATTDLPVSYSGFAGGIDAYGRGANARVLITAQEGVGSGPICDVLVYAHPD